MKETMHPFLQGEKRGEFDDRAEELLNSINFDKLFPSKKGQDHPQYFSAKERAKTLLMSGVDEQEIKERLLNSFVHNTGENLIEAEGIDWKDKAGLIENLTALFIDRKDQKFSDVLTEITRRYKLVADHITAENKKAQDELVKKVAADVERITKYLNRRK